RWRTEDNRTILQDLSCSFNIDIELFNHSAHQKIDFSGYYNTKLIALKELEKDNYLNRLYNQLLNSDIEAQINFQSLIDSFINNNAFKITSPILNLDHIEHFSSFMKQTFPIEGDLKDINWKMNYEPNR